MTTFHKAERMRLAKKGMAMSDGRYPIRNRIDLKNAIGDYNRTGQSPVVKAHILKRARALGALDALPSTWKESTVTQGYMQLVTAEGEARYFPYTTDLPIEQDGVGVPGDAASASQPEVGEINPVQGLKMNDSVTDQTSLLCNACGKRFTNQKTLSKHAMAKHGGGATAGTPPLQDAMVKQDSSVANFCPNDGTASNGANFCTTCGKDLRDNVTDPDENADDEGDRVLMADAHITQSEGSMVLQANAAKQIVTGIVQTPDVVVRPSTLNGVELVYPKETIAQMAYDFMRDMKNGAIGVVHGEVVNGKVVSPQGDKATVVESYIMPCDGAINGHLVKQGSWVQSVHIHDKDTWNRVTSGELQAFSLASHDVDLEDMEE